MKKEELEKLTLKEIKELIKKGDKKVLNELLEYLLDFNKAQVLNIKKLLRMFFGINLDENWS
jgi:hypothetical protein